MKVNSRRKVLQLQNTSCNRRKTWYVSIANRIYFLKCFPVRLKQFILITSNKNLNQGPQCSTYWMLKLIKQVPGEIVGEDDAAVVALFSYQAATERSSKCSALSLLWQWGYHHTPHMYSAKCDCCNTLHWSNTYLLMSSKQKISVLSRQKVNVYVFPNGFWWHYNYVLCRHYTCVYVSCKLVYMCVCVCVWPENSFIQGFSISNNRT